MVAKIVFNAIPLSVGGGLQKTLALMKEASAREVVGSHIHWVVTQGSALHQCCLDLELDHTTVRPGRLGRLIGEISVARGFEKGTICLNLGGAVMVGSVDRLINVSECAYSNLFYPEIDFWRYESVLGRLRRRLIDVYRKYAIALSDAWIFQTGDIEDRAKKLPWFPEDRCFCIRPAFSGNVMPALSDTPKEKSFRKMFGGRKVFLFACGPQKNKRLHRLPELARDLRRNCSVEFLFVITCDVDDEYVRMVINEAKSFGVADNFLFVGPSSGVYYSSLLSASDFVCNFAVLESFSNNFIEAWLFKKPLLATDASWARNVAENAALYVDPENWSRSITDICELLVDPERGRSLTNWGERLLREFSDPKDKLEAYLKILRGVDALGGLGPRFFPSLRWALTV